MDNCTQIENQVSQPVSTEAYGLGLGLPAAGAWEQARVYVEVEGLLPSNAIGIKHYEHSLSNAQVRLKSALHRFYTGMSARETSDLQFVTLTTPEDFDRSKLNHAWRKFCLRMKRAQMWGEYYAVREWNERGTCEHLHVLVKVQKLEYDTLRKHWTNCVNAECETPRTNIWVKVVPCYGNNQGLGNYLAKYLAKQQVTSQDGYFKRWGRSYWYSQRWIFPSWRLISGLMFRLGEIINFVDYANAFRYRDCKEVKTSFSIAILAKWRRVRKLTWSITLGKELRQLGIIWDRCVYERDLLSG